MTGRRILRYYSDLQIVVLHTLFVLGSLDGLEIAVGVDLKLAGGRLVKHNGAKLVELEGRQGHIVAYAALDGLSDHPCLLASEGEDENLLGAADSGYTH